LRKWNSFCLSSKSKNYFFVDASIHLVFFFISNGNVLIHLYIEKKKKHINNEYMSVEGDLSCDLSFSSLLSNGSMIREEVSLWSIGFGIFKEWKRALFFTSLSLSSSSCSSSFAFAQRESNRIYVEKREREKRWMPVVLLPLPRWDETNEWNVRSAY
jgi:hypothetical protein